MNENTCVEPLKLRHLEVAVRGLARVHESLDIREIIQSRLDAVVAREPEPVVAEDAWLAY